MKRTLYLGLHPPKSTGETEYVHFPIITIVPKDPFNKDLIQVFESINRYTHIVFTSGEGVRIFFEFLSKLELQLLDLKQFIWIAVGRATERVLKSYGVDSIIRAEQETAEGVVEILDALALENASILWPHSALARTVISAALKERKVDLTEVVLYDVCPVKTLPAIDLSTFDTFFFTSPSTVDAFISLFGSLPTPSKIEAIGPITQSFIKSVMLTAMPGHFFNTSLSSVTKEIE